MGDGAAVNMVQALMQEALGAHDERWQARFDDIPRAVESARAKLGKTQEQPPKPFTFTNISEWSFDNVTRREWAVFNRIPLRQTCLFSGEGAAGKSLTQLYLCAAHVLGRDWLGSMPEPGPAFFIDAEDDEKELHRRLAAILEHYRASFQDAIDGGLYLKSMVAEDAVLASTTKGGIVQPTALYKGLLERAGDLKPKMIGIASAANVFAGNEVVRPEVQQFISLLTRLAVAANGAVNLISHPSLTGIKNDTGLSGSTQWHNAVRARMWLHSPKAEPGEEPDNDLREIVFKKNNYGTLSETVVLRYRDGLFLPVAGASSLDKLAQESRADDVFVTLLRRFTTQNRNVSDKKGTSYAPALFARENEAKQAGLNSKTLEDAMRRLFAAGKIYNEQYGRPSRPHYRIALKG
jgi:RecA-family ATPase